MLSLLPRSATGQKLSVYTQLIHLPRRADEMDGARERHLIIIDNGRSRLQNSPLREALYCIRCGACLNACPVFRELSGHAYVGIDGSIAPYQVRSAPSFRRVYWGWNNSDIWLKLHRYAGHVKIFVLLTLICQNY